MTSWTDSEIQVLENNYSQTSKSALLKMLGKRSWEATRNKARHLGLQRSRIPIAYRDAPQGCKRCGHCKQFKHLTDFESDRGSKDGHSCYCKDCGRALRSTLEYMVKMRESGRKYRQGTRLKALQMIAKSDIPKCANCGCDFLPILEVNHKHGQGSKEYREIGSAIGLFRAIVTGVRGTDDLEVLCEVCNRFHYVKMRYGGYLPFQIQWKKPLMIELRSEKR